MIPVEMRYGDRRSGPGSIARATSPTLSGTPQTMVSHATGFRVRFATALADLISRTRTSSAARIEAMATTASATTRPRAAPGASVTCTAEVEQPSRHWLIAWLHGAVGATIRYAVPMATSTGTAISTSSRSRSFPIRPAGKVISSRAATGTRATVAMRDAV